MTLTRLKKRWKPLLQSNTKPTQAQLNAYSREVQAYKKLNPHWRDAIY